MKGIWWVLMVAGLGALIFTQPSAALSSMVTGANEAVKLSMSRAASYALWLGFFALIEGLGVGKLIAKIFKPIISFLFPHASERARELITLNASANVIGLGNAATPVGINAMAELEASIVDDENNRISDDMAMLLVVSATGLQLLPTTMLGLRVSMGSENATAVLFPCVVATVCSTVIGVLACKLIALILHKTRGALRSKQSKSKKLRCKTKAAGERA